MDEIEYRLLRADPSEIALLAEGFFEFYAESKMQGKPDLQRFSSLMLSGISSGRIFVLVAFKTGLPVGAIAAQIGPNWASDLLTAQEMFWFVRPDYRHGTAGIRLFHLFVGECKARGARCIGVAHFKHLTPDSLKKLYEREGFKECETHYSLDIDYEIP